MTADQEGAPMTFRQVKDIITLVRNCHRQLREWLELPRTRTRDDATARLMEMLRRDENALQIAMTQMGSDEDQAVLNTWLQYAPSEEVTDTLKLIRFDANLPIDEVLARKQRLDDALLRLYGQLASSCSAPRVQELFRRLHEYTESRVHSQSWAVRDPQGPQ